MAYRIGVRNLYHCGGTVGVAQGLSIALVCVNAAAENVGPAVFAAEDGPLGKYRKTVEGGGAVVANYRIGEDPVVKGYINTVMVAIERHGFHVNIGVQQFRTTNPGAGAGIQNGLRASG